jgi:integrase
MKRRRRPRGTGAVFQQPGSRYLWIGYPSHGRYVRESTGSTKKLVAQKLLDKRIAQIQGGDFLGPEVDRVRVGELSEPLFADYRINGKAIGWAKRCWDKHLKPLFGPILARAVSTDAINSYIEHRRQEGASNATINRELSILQRMFTLAYHSHPKRVSRTLTFNRLAESPPRSGFVGDEQYHALCNVAVELAKPWLRAMLAIAYRFGFRKGELLNMRVRQVDLLNRTIRLEPGSTKSGEGRTVKMTQEAYLLLTECVRGKGSNDYVFTRKGGQRVRDFRESWAEVTKSATLPSLLFHDLRRSAVRNMIRSGVPERVAMAISGHKTRSVFDRYNIVSPADLEEAARRIEGVIHSSFIVKPQAGVSFGPTGNLRPAKSVSYQHAGVAELADARDSKSRAV